MPEAPHGGTQEDPGSPRSYPGVSGEARSFVEVCRGMPGHGPLGAKTRSQEVPGAVSAIPGPPGDSPAIPSTHCTFYREKSETKRARHRTRSF